MRLYTVHAPPAAGDPTAWVFVKEGFCWPALFIPLIWLIYRRLWSILLVYVAAVVLIGIVSIVAGGPALTVFSLLASIWFAAEANEFRRWTLGRRGWRLVGVAGGRRLAEAELAFFYRHAAVPASPPLSTISPPPSPTRPAPPAPDEPEIIGLFPAPGSHA